MKIVHVINGFLPQDSGGTQLQVRDLCHVQRRQGHQALVFTRTAGDEREELALSRDEWEGIPVTRLNNNFLGCDRFELLYTHPQIDQRFRGFLEAERPDVVHVHHLTCLSTSMIEVAKGLELTVVMTMHDYWLQCPRGQRFHPEEQAICETLDRARCLSCLQKLWPHLLPAEAPAGTPDSLAKLHAWEAHVRQMLELCDATITPSAFHRDRFLENGLPPERCYVVANGLPRGELAAPPRGRRPIRRVGFTGMVLPSKGVHVLIEAFNLLDREELSLEIYGEAVPYHEKTDYLEDLRALARPHLTVRFHGRYEIQDLPEILRAIDLLVIPSLWWESYCLTAREGVLAGLPVIVCDLAGLSEAVAQGLAVGSEPGDAAALARTIARLCDDADLRDQMSRKAHLVRDTVECAREIEEIYRLAGAG